MKTFLFLFCFSCLNVDRVRAQVQELEQLALNLEKLMQFKKILSDMKDGYEVLAQGYGTVRDISQGNFNLHKAFLDGLLDVSPAVKKYKRIMDILSVQIQLMKENKTGYRRAQSSGLFSRAELQYLSGVFRQIFDQSRQSISALTAVLTAGKLRMSDAERLRAIDAIYDHANEQIVFIRHFNSRNALLALQRYKERNDAKGIGNMYK